MTHDNIAGPGPEALVTQSRDLAPYDERSRPGLPENIRHLDHARSGQVDQEGIIDRTEDEAGNVVGLIGVCSTHGTKAKKLARRKRCGQRVTD